MIEISQAVLNIREKSANEIFGSPDDLKLRSCMTLFANVLDADSIFRQVLDRYFDGKQDEQTLCLLLKNKLQHDTV